MTYALLKLGGVFVPLRVFREHKMEGLDITQHGEALH
jgi:Amt family ammonium transporter